MAGSGRRSLSRDGGKVLHVTPQQGGVPVAVALRRNPRARRLILSVDPGDARPALVIPAFVSVGEAQEFLEQRRDWLFRRLAALPARAPFAAGTTVPFKGESLRLRHRPDARGVAWRDGAHLDVAGDPRHLARRATDWLKAEARRDFALRAARMARELGRPAPRVAIRDPKRQWGSCSSDGTLRLSWRLVMAPEPVIDYVVAHEVAHLVEMNHAAGFWTIVARLTPHMATARIWLRRNGHSLLRYG
ncbi:MAG: M48 family metallopeptidase [Alphaproteobacteria bacterium]|nr:M48 family metallopeptidase [Alphaproteobacteria bacterium]